MNKLIVITGLDGSGTSSIAEEISKKDPSSHLIKTPNSPFDQYRKLIDEKVRNQSQAAHYFFYLSSVIFASTEIETLLETGNVYCVRYLIDTVVSHRVAGLNVDLDYESDLYSIHRPDLTLFVKINEKTRQNRITNRGKGLLDRVLDDDSVRLKFHQEFNRFSNHFVEIDNSLSIQTTLKNAINYMPWIKNYD
jgi:thymidylate kinase